ncbi:hypothetical protein [Leifsonia shinshuensis]|uniref:hypothetical protein n=1 Tax=Leifsonia shinshuensis TaxID=150026 RepID=UPI002856BE8B|nr:hypothetical protein [Leifsonia shinshuensis]MDR6971566.1 hypothetical protein [Leifsonia shinshuensis]
MTDLSESGEHQYLSAGAIVGGQRPSARRWSETYRAWAKALEVASEDMSGPLSVSFVFLVPGEILSADFTEPKITAFRRKKQQIEIQIPLSESVPEHPYDAMTLEALSALTVIEEWARKHKRVEDVLPVRAIVASLKRSN